MKYPTMIAIGTVALLAATLSIPQARAMGGTAASPAAGSPSPARGSTEVQSKSAEKKLAKLTAALNLSTEEQAKIRPVLDQEAEQVKALRADTTLSKADHSAKLRAIHADTKAKIATMLNADQQKKFADMGAGHRTGSANKS